MSQLRPADKECGFVGYWRVLYEGVEGGRPWRGSGAERAPPAIAAKDLLSWASWIMTPEVALMILSAGGWRGGSFQ